MDRTEVITFQIAEIVNEDCISNEEKIEQLVSLFNGMISDITLLKNVVHCLTMHMM